MQRSEARKNTVLESLKGVQRGCSGAREEQMRLQRAEHLVSHLAELGFYPKGKR